MALQNKAYTVKDFNLKTFLLYILPTFNCCLLLEMLPFLQFCLIPTTLIRKCLTIQVYDAKITQNSHCVTTDLDECR